ncbi:MAG: hypothetical protein ACREOQ_03270 [Gemmatimonadales bacterium]
MVTRPTPSIVLAPALMLALACNSPNPTQPTALTATDPAPDVSSALAAAAATTSASGAAAAESRLPEFDPGDFVRHVTNPLFPLPLGTTLIYRGTEDGLPERVVTEVTTDHKTILGVPVVVVLDRVFLNGVLKEKTFDWYAQDQDGNVWYFGEDTKEFENGKVISTAGSFEAGKNGAHAGIIMRAHPVLGQTTPQEFAAGVAEDKGKVLDLDATVTVPYGTLPHCLKQAEFTPLEPAALEHKFYCPGIGIARERDVSGGTVNTALAIVRR